jgi:hypothetical protein
MVGIMAHFAKIENGVVVEVVVVDNAHESNGESYLNALGLLGKYVQTSYNANSRGKFAGLGDTYNAEKDRFESAKPYASWKWNEIQYDWEAPTAHPEDGSCKWNEETLTWIEEPIA